MKRKESSQQVAFRLPDSLIERIDQYAEYLSERAHGAPINRTDVAKVLFEKALEGFEPPKGKRK